jgi:Ca2+-binding RTX toxin-like protein
MLVSTSMDPRARLVTAGVFAVSVAVAFSVPALAENLSGGKKGEKIAGTKGADTIKGKGGNDKLKGKGGNDTLNGGKGRDQVTGGQGADRHLGGPGNDLIKAADGRRDKKINGGSGRNTCVIDTAVELGIAKRCHRIIGAATGPPPGPGEGLRLIGVTGLVGCDQTLPLCAFDITGDGADAPTGQVSGVGGVTAVGGAVNTDGTNWTAAGGYGCQGDGFIRITIGTETADVPVDCP